MKTFEEKQLEKYGRKVMEEAIDKGISPSLLVRQKQMEKFWDKVMQIGCAILFANMILCVAWSYPGCPIPKFYTPIQLALDILECVMNAVNFLLNLVI